MSVCVKDETNIIKEGMTAEWQEKKSDWVVVISLNSAAAVKAGEPNLPDDLTPPPDLCK